MSTRMEHLTRSRREATSESEDSSMARIPEGYALVQVEEYDKLRIELVGVARRADQQEALLKEAAVAVDTTRSLVLSEPALKEKEVPAAAGGKRKSEAKRAPKAPGVNRQRFSKIDDSSLALEEECQREYKNLLRRAIRQEKKRLALMAAQVRSIAWRG